MLGMHVVLGELTHGLLVSGPIELNFIAATVIFMDMNVRSGTVDGLTELCYETPVVPDTVPPRQPIVSFPAPVRQII